MLVAVNCIPAELLRQQILESAEVLSHETVYQKVTANSLSGLDNFTDTIMLGEAAFPAKNPFTNALVAERYVYEARNPFDTFLKIWENPNAVDETRVSTTIYPRYWHGYLVLLKPLLMFFNYKRIRQLNAIVLSILLGLVFCLIQRKKQARTMGFSLTLAVLCMIPEAVARSMQFSTTTYMTLLGMIIVLTQSKDRSLLWHTGLFSLLGIGTVYFDFLTFPTLSLTLPCCALLTVLHEKALKEKVITTGCCILAWFFGYGGMWIGKWILGVLAFGSAFLQEHVFEQIKFRFSHDYGQWQFSRIDTIRKRLAQCFVEPTYKTLFLIVVAALFVYLFYICIKERKLWITHTIPYLMILAVPFLWTFAVCNHSGIHTMTYRTFISAVFIVPTALASAIPTADSSLTKCVQIK